MTYNRNISHARHIGFALGILGQLYAPRLAANPMENSFVKQAVQARYEEGVGSERVESRKVDTTNTLERCVMENKCESVVDYRPQDRCKAVMNEYSVPATGRRGLIGGSSRRLVGSSHIRLAKEKYTYGRQELVDVLNYAACVMEQVYGTPLEVRDLSREGGGRLWPHKSHRHGRDADVGMYGYNDLQGLYSTSRRMVRGGRVDREFMAPQALDANVQFLSELVRGPYSVERVFVDRKVIRALGAYAIGKYGDAFWQPIKDVLDHEPGHTNHYHIRTRVRDGKERPET